MKHPLIQAPEGSRFVRLDQWIVDTLGGGKSAHVAAACTAQLEFWHRVREERAGWIERTMDDFVLAMGGLFGRDKILDGLRLLEEAGWLESAEKTERNGQLWIRKKQYRLNLDLINQESRKYAEKSKKNDLSALGTPINRQSEQRFSVAPSAEKSSLNKTKIKNKTKSSSSYAHAREPTASLWIVENPQDELLEDELLSSLPGGRAELNEEAAELIKAGKRPYLSSIQKAITASNKKAAARQQAEQQAAKPTLSPEKKAAQLIAANLRGALRQEHSNQT